MKEIEKKLNAAMPCRDKRSTIGGVDEGDKANAEGKGVIKEI
jgi:hypothetical protein